MKLIRKFTPKGTNKVGIVDFQFGNSSNEEDWLLKIGEVFKGLKFKTAVKTGNTFSLSSKKLTMFDLKREKKERKTSSQRLKVVPADKGEFFVYIVKLFNGLRIGSFSRQEYPKIIQSGYLMFNPYPAQILLKSCYIAWVARNLEISRF